MFSSVSLLSVGRAEQKALRTNSVEYCASVRDVTLLTYTESVCAVVSVL